MANNKSSKKRILISKRNRLVNRFYKSSVKNLIKSYLKNVDLFSNSKKLEYKTKARNQLRLIYKFLDKGIKKNVFHRNMVSRQKLKLSKYLTENIV